MTKILHVVGARPNFMKVAPVIHAMRDHRHSFTQVLVHTGQHYDTSMSDVFFKELDMPEPDENLGVGSGSHAVQTAQIMIRFETVLLDHRPDWVFVPGDVNSTIACALVAVKLGIKVAHLEAGLRSFDRSMPEEINRVLTDCIADLLFTPSSDAEPNLISEGIASERIRFVGNLMIDTLVRLRPAAERLWPELQSRYGLHSFGLATFHRPSNVDSAETLLEIVAALREVATTLPIIFPVHPRTREKMRSVGIDVRDESLKFIDPVGYLECLALQSHSELVITDSGGIQEETTYLGIPCLTIRRNTERPITITEGTNRLISQERSAICRAVDLVRAQKAPVRIPELWDGKAARRVVDVMKSLS